METAPPAESFGSRKWWICGWLLLATMIMYMDRLVLTQQEATIRADFGILEGDNANYYYGLLETAFSIAFACGALAAGLLADAWSVWLLYPILVILWSTVGGVTGFISGYWVLFTCRFFLGLFEAGHWPCALKTTQRILTPAERTLGNGILQSGAAVGSVLTPLILLGFAAASASEIPSWRPPFIALGALGILWALGWFLLVPRLDKPHAPAAGSIELPRRSLLDVYRDKRFWVLLFVVVCINSTWHFFRVWMPVILRELHEFDSKQVQFFSIAYYLAADAGSLATGFLAILVVRSGFSVHAGRLTVFGLCSLMVLLSLAAILAPGQPVFLWVLPIVAFGSLGLFPPYYSYTQELTVRDQGLVTGSLGFICWMVMAVLRPLEGAVSDFVKAQGGTVADRYAFGIILAGLMPLAATAALFFFWPRETAPTEKLAEWDALRAAGLQNTADQQASQGIKKGEPGSVMEPPGA